MPYITKEERDVLLAGIRNSQTAGELNFLFTSIISEYITEKTLNYQTVNDIIGALEGAKMELYRRVVAPYEDKKIRGNGDVY